MESGRNRVGTGSVRVEIAGSRTRAQSWHGWSSFEPSPVVALLPSRGRMKAKFGSVPFLAAW